tara:strand:- start:1565 stop:2668 length:1104 start_codon:yes stop_codon:yes gene_type:complete
VAKAKKDANVTKKQPKIAMGKGTSRVEYKGDSFKELWSEWESAAKSITAADMGISRFTGTLYDILAKHGISGRIMGNSGPKETPGIGKELKFLASLARKPKFKPKEMESLKGIVQILNEYGGSESDLNPRNIKFEGIVDVFRGKPEKKSIYGHYRTDDYVKYREGYKDKEELDPVDNSWWSTNKGEAKPPMWQAIYGDGSDEPFNVKGLVEVVTEAVKVLGTATHHIIQSDPVAIENEGAAKFAYEGLSELKTAMDRMVKDPQYTTPAGNFSSKKARTRLMKIPYNVKNNTESENVKTLLEAKGTPGQVEDFYIYISRRQINHMAKLAGWKPHPESTYMKNKEKEDEEVKTSADKETRDWRTIMKVI